MKTFNTKKVDWMKQPMFFGEEPNTQRFDQQKYPIFEKLNQQQLGFFWRPEEVSLQKDRNDYAQLTKEQKVLDIGLKMSRQHKKERTESEKLQDELEPIDENI